MKRDHQKLASGPARDVEGTPRQESTAGAHYDHEEWLLDESLVETFPASDPIAPALPPEEVPLTSPAAAANRVG